MRIKYWQLKPAVTEAALHAFLVLLFYSLLFTAFFSPVLFNNSLLAPADGFLYHFAFYQSEKVFWDTLLACGFPMTADPQVMAWYPPSLILSLLPNTWNIFVLSAYIMASCFTYGYVYALTESRLAGLISGIIFSMCGFMMAHLGHTAIIHVAAWLPLIIWSLEMLRRKLTRGWLAIGCLAVACCILAGHLQIVVNCLLLSACYLVVLGWKAFVGRKRYYLVSSLLLLIGLGLTALQILPTLELANLSTRSEYSFADFTSYSFPVRQVVLLIFPGIFGGLSHYGVPTYFGRWNLTELTGYVGLLPLMLAAVGLVTTRRKAVSIFWLCAGLLALLLALGNQSPLAHLVYQLPIIGKFRVPARHFIEMALAVSVLAGIGTQAILSQMVTKRLLFKIVLVAAAVMLTGILALISNHSTEYSSTGGVVRFNALPWANAAVAMPILVFLATALMLLYWHRSPKSLPRRILLLLVLVLDVSSFGWFYSWQRDSPPESASRPPVFLDNYQNSLQDSKQRALAVRGALGTMSEIPPNLSRLWEIPSASGYGPLSLSRATQLLSLRPDASVDPSWKNPDNQSLNLAAVRYVFLPRPEYLKDARGILWEKENMDSWLGSGCDHPPANSLKFDLGKPVRATTIGIVSRLACSTSLPDGEEVARVLVTDSTGTVQTKTMAAGRDTAEWAYDCPGVTPQMKHTKAQIFNSFPAAMYDKPCEGHFYLAQLGLDDSKEIRQIEIQWAGGSGAMTIDKISLIDEPAKSAVPISSLAKENSQWRFVEEAGEAHVYENLRSRPRAWLVSESIVLEPFEILKAIKTSRLPDGRIFNPSQMVLVEESLPVMSETPDQTASARVERLSSSTMEVRTSSRSGSFLVTSDTFYPGWQATVDGSPVRIFRANYALRGVAVPAGDHLVRFEFRPKSFYMGAAISALSLFLLGGLLLFAFPKLAGRDYHQGYQVDSGKDAHLT